MAHFWLKENFDQHSKIWVFDIIITMAKALEHSL